MEKRENQRIMLSKRLIKESLTRLLASESIHKISVRMLCEEAGINRSTFYKYYGSQYDVDGSHSHFSRRDDASRNRFA